MSAAALAVCLLLASAARAQTTPRFYADSAVSRRPVLLGSPEDQRARDRQLLDTDPSAFSLLRSASARGGLATPTGNGVRLLAPDVRVVWNSALPFSLNDGALWAGRGWSGIARAGVDARAGRVRLLLLPELTASENVAFDFRANTRSGRSPYAWPWGTTRYDADLPSRFGDRSWLLVALGQSAASVDVGTLAIGVSTENEWWGPGARNALILGDNAEGFPHAFARTRRPVRTGIGDVEGRWEVGVLTTSLFADSALDAPWRALGAATVTLRPSSARSVTVGVARSVVTRLPQRARLATHLFDPVARWERSPRDSAASPAADQYASLFGRWVVTRAQAEVYGEWARQGTPRSLRELLLAPHEAGALTLGLQAFRPWNGSRTTRVRLQIEATSVEQSIAFRDRPPPPPFYAGLATRAGYTNRGQSLGAAIGPGGSSQSVGADVVRRRAEAGLFVGRIRWNDDALFDQPNPTFFRHDVSTFVGARAVARLAATDVAADVRWARRYNYLFQNGFANPGNLRTVDLTNVTFGLSMTPR